MLKTAHFKTAIHAAKEASKAILKVYGSGIFDVEQKHDQSPVTLADKKSHEIIIHHLSDTGIPVLSEEGQDIPFDTRSKWEYLWLVDPLDGTKEFLKKNGEFTVNIALIHWNKPVWGVVCIPIENKCYFGGPGEGAFMEENGKLIKLKTKPKEFNNSTNGTRVAVSRSHLDEKTKAFISGLDSPVLVSRGSSLKFMMLAEGEADLYPRFSPTMEWDTAAAHAILNALGWEIFREGSQKALSYNKENLENPGFIVK